MATPCSSTDPVRRGGGGKPPKSAGLPLVVLNLAISADGRIATANHRIHTFGSRRDLHQLYRLRATADAILCGARTLRITHADLGPGPRRYRPRSPQHALHSAPLRVVASGTASINPRSRLFRTPGSAIIVLTTTRAPADRVRRLRRAGAQVVAFGKTTLDFKAALRWLHRHHRVRRLLAEGGGELNQALFRAGLIHEVHLTFCPLILGGARSPTVADGLNPLSLTDAIRCRLQQRRQVGSESFAVYRVLRTRRAPRQATSPSSSLAISQSKSAKRLR